MTELTERIPPWLRPVLAYGPIAVVGVLLAYFSLFSQFATYDDSGHLSVSLTEFMHGRTLYDDLYSQYGPLYFEFFGGLFSLPGLDLTTDSVRIVALIFWVVTGLWIGVLAERMTADRRLGVLCAIVAVGALSLLRREPMHPLGITTTLVTAILAAAAWNPARDLRKTAVWIGVTVGALAMVKINMGALAAVAVVASALLVLAPPAHRRLLQVGAAALMVLAITVLLSKELNEEWVQRVFVLMTAGTVAIAIRAGALSKPDAGLPSAGPWLLRCFGALFGITLVIALIICALGTSPAQLIDGVIVDPTRHPGIDSLVLELPLRSIEWSIIALGLAAASTAIYNWRSGGSRTISIGSRALVGLAMFYSLLGKAPLSLTPASGPIAISVLFAWLAAVAPRELKETTPVAFARMTVVLVCVLETLQAYPTAGSQLDAGAFPFALVGVLLLSDSIRLLAKASSKLPAKRAQWIALATTVAIAIAGVQIGIVAVLKPLKENAGAWRHETQLDLPGARLLRLPDKQAYAYQQIAATVKKYHCDPVVTLPGMYSFHGWFKDRPPTGYNVSDWMLLINEKRQREMIAAVKDNPNMCLLSNSVTEKFYDDISDPPNHELPFYDYLKQVPLKRVLTVEDGLPNPFTHQPAYYTLSVRPGNDGR